MGTLTLSVGDGWVTEAMAKAGVLRQVVADVQHCAGRCIRQMEQGHMTEADALEEMEDVVRERELTSEGGGLELALEQYARSSVSAFVRALPQTVKLRFRASASETVAASVSEAECEPKATPKPKSKPAKSKSTSKRTSKPSGERKSKSKRVVSGPPVVEVDEWLGKPMSALTRKQQGCVVLFETAKWMQVPMVADEIVRRLKAEGIEADYDKVNAGLRTPLRDMHTDGLLVGEGFAAGRWYGMPGTTEKYVPDAESAEKNAKRLESVCIGPV